MVVKYPSSTSFKTVKLRRHLLLFQIHNFQDWLTLLPTLILSPNFSSQPFVASSNSWRGSCKGRARASKSRVRPFQVGKERLAIAYKYFARFNAPFHPSTLFQLHQLPSIGVLGESLLLVGLQLLLSIVGLRFNFSLSLSGHLLRVCVLESPALREVFEVGVPLTLLLGL